VQEQAKKTVPRAMLSLKRAGPGNAEEPSGKNPVQQVQQGDLHHDDAWNGEPSLLQEIREHLQRMSQRTGAK